MKRRGGKVGEKVGGKSGEKPGERKIKGTEKCKEISRD